MRGVEEDVVAVPTHPSIMLNALLHDRVRRELSFVEHDARLVDGGD